MRTMFLVVPVLFVMAPAAASAQAPDSLAARLRAREAGAAVRVELPWAGAEAPGRLVQVLRAAGLVADSTGPGRVVVSSGGGRASLTVEPGAAGRPVLVIGVGSRSAAIEARVLKAIRAERLRAGR